MKMYRIHHTRPANARLNQIEARERDGYHPLGIPTMNYYIVPNVPVMGKYGHGGLSQTELPET
jgi:hypothetical protein